MESKEYLKDISEIRSMMSRSSRFVSLSGYAGIFAGIYAITGAFLGRYVFFSSLEIHYVLDTFMLIKIGILLLSIAGLSFVTSYYFTTKLARKNNVKVWDVTTRLMLINFFIPMFVGGILIIILLAQSFFGLAASMMLLFYGLSLINASKYTIGNVRYLGFFEVMLGLFCAAFPSFGFWAWVVGFGVAHILYGFILFKTEK